jgi:hypothetical protein
MKIKQYILQINLIGILIFGMSCVSYSQESEEKEYKNEVGFLYSFEKNTAFKIPQFGVSYARKIHKQNLLIYGNLMIRPDKGDGYLNKGFISDFGLEGRIGPIGSLPLYIVTQLGFGYKRLNSSSTDQLNYKFMDDYQYLTLHFTPMISYGNLFKVSIGRDVGYGKCFESHEKEINGVIQSESNSSWLFLRSKYTHLKISYSF